MVKYNSLPTSEQVTSDKAATSEKTANSEKTAKKGKWNKAKKVITNFILGYYCNTPNHQNMYPFPVITYQYTA